MWACVPNSHYLVGWNPHPSRRFAVSGTWWPDCVADMHSTGEPVPEPLADRAYSGKFMVRVPPETHRALAMRAAEEGVSLNRLVSARLAHK